jgi:choline-glycine betaine transporter
MVAAVVPCTLVIVAVMGAIVVALARRNYATGDEKDHSEQTASERDTSLARHGVLRWVVRRNMRSEC